MIGTLPSPVHAPVATSAGGRVRVRLLVRPALRRPGSRLLVRDWLAMTIGTTIVSWRLLEPHELAHELEHVRQWQRHGRARYVLRYGLASLRARRSGGDWYRDNEFERAARRAAAPVGGDGACDGAGRGVTAGDTPRQLS